VSASDVKRQLCGVSLKLKSTQISVLFQSTSGVGKLFFVVKKLQSKYLVFVGWMAFDAIVQVCKSATGKQWRLPCNK
jgi:hypothetical protein